MSEDFRGGIFFDSRCRNTLQVPPTRRSTHFQWQQLEPGMGCRLQHVPPTRCCSSVKKQKHICSGRRIIVMLHVSTNNWTFFAPSLVIAKKCIRGALRRVNFREDATLTP